jgi:hypothetical protein
MPGHEAADTHSDAEADHDGAFIHGFRLQSDDRPKWLAYVSLNQALASSYQATGPNFAMSFPNG